MKNFYVADLLKSVESEDSAIQLTQDVKRLCQHGGFNLTLLPAEKVFLNQFQKIIREVGVKNRDLDGELPEERKMYSRLLRKCGVVEDLLYSS